jgi:hypothetical protein
MKAARRKPRIMGRGTSGKERLSRLGNPALRRSGRSQHLGSPRLAIASMALCAAMCILALGATSALAKRSLESKIPGFSGTYSVAIDGNNDVWVSDRGRSGNPGQDGIYKYSPFPSQTLLGIPNSYSVWGYYILDLQVATDNANGEVFVAQSNGRSVDIFAPSTPAHECKQGEPACYSHSWTAINKANTCFNCLPDIHIAIDNSNTYSKGRVYLSLTSPENDVEALDAAQRPVDFPATATYISNNRLTGTPSGSFGQVGNISVDSGGNIYVTDWESHLVDEFESSGTFVRSFPAPGSGQGYPAVGGVGVDPTNADVLIASGSGVNEYDSSGNLLGTITQDDTGGIQTGPAPAVNSEGDLYIPVGDRVDVFGPSPPVPKVSYKPVTTPSTTAGTLNAMVDPNGGGGVTSCKFEYGTNTSYGAGSIPCSSETFSSPTEVSASVSGLTVETTYHYRVVVTNTGGIKYGADQTYTPHHVRGLTTDAVSNLSERDATLNASFLGSGEETHYYFEWGPTASYGKTSVAPPGTVIAAPSGQELLSVQLESLTPFSTYHYRIVASNGEGTSYGEDQKFTTLPGVPTGQGPAATVVHADRVVFHGEVDPNGADTKIHFEYVSDTDFQTSGWTNALTTPEEEIGMSKHYQSASAFVTGLTEGTLYHYRIVGTNAVGNGSSPVAAFRSFGFTPTINDNCPNAHVRQQTGASLLLDCRAYELVSAANAGGYDVESYLVSGETPFANYPEAESPPEGAKVLYGVHDGGIPGTGSPTNHGVDPYVATRGSEGWSTKYVGIPATDQYATGPFASTLEEANPGLGTLAFGGPEICSPCFSDHSTGEPIHIPNGELVQGMAGSIAQPAAKPAGFIGRALSADGSHFIFGSTSKMEPGGNEGEVSIYDRDLKSHETHLVSKTPEETNLPCLTQCSSNGIGELGISADGSRVVVGQLVSESGSARSWRLYMNIGDSPKTIELTPGATDGALFDGMTADGSKVFFTTVDKLTNEDTDHSADIYEAEISPSGSPSLHLITSGSEGTGNTDSCEPSANTVHPHWNTTGSEEDCGVVAIGGGGGVALDSGTIYFLSPERLDGSEHGVQNAPNLYVVSPGGAPHFIATLESTANAPLPPTEHPFQRSIGSAIENPAGVAIEHATGDVYVLDIGGTAGTGYVYKFDSSGHPVTGFANNGVLTVSGVYGSENVPTELAFDQAHGDLYVPDLLDGRVNKYNSSGSHLAQIEGVSFPTGVAVDQANGDVYAASAFGEIAIFDENGTPINSFSTKFSFPTGPTGLAVDSTGKIYVVNGGGFAAARGTTEIYNSAGADLGQFSSGPARGVSVDPSNDHVYINEGNQVSEFDSLGNAVGVPTGSGTLLGSLGLAADHGTLAISNPGSTNVALYGPPVLPPDPNTDNPVVVDSVSSPGTLNTADFQANPKGGYAVFTSTLPLTNYGNAAHREVFRYAESGETLECVSCNPTGEQATGDATLAPNGLSISNDGRVFFNSTEGLVDRDLNEKRDVYEWEPEGTEAVKEAEPCTTGGGCIDLISTGTSPYNSSLLGISASGTDAYFFTRDTLVSSDENGSRVKLYDARSSGGYPQLPPPIPCQASDECHGPSSQAPPATNIKTTVGIPIGNHQGTSTKATCKHGLVKKKGRCVRAKVHRHHRRRQHRANGHG